MKVKIVETKADGTQKITQPTAKTPFKKVRLQDRPMKERIEINRLLATRRK